MEPLVDEDATGVWSWKTICCGGIDSSYFFVPLNFYSKGEKKLHHLRFRRNYEFAPLILSILLGFQHACAALAFIVVPGMILGQVYPNTFGYYVMQAATIIAGICTILNCLEIKSNRIPFQIGTGLISILQNSAAFVPVYLGCMYKLIVEKGYGEHEAFGKLLGSTAVCTVAYILLTCIPRKYMKHLFPPFVSGTIIILIGMSMIKQAIQLWGGGVTCSDFASREFLCRMEGDVHLPYGSPEYIGIGLFVIVLYLLCEFFGTPFIHHNIVTVTVLTVFAVVCFLRKDGDYYVNGDNIDDIPPVAFLWTTTYKLGFYDGAILPVFGAYLVNYLESTAVLSATLEESNISLNGSEADKKIQGGLLVSAFGSLFSVLATGIPLVPLSYSSTIVGVTKQASSSIGIAAGIWLLFIGVVGKTLGIYLDIPASIKGAIGSILLVGIIVTGFKILSREKWDRRMIIVVFFAFTFGLARVVEEDFINDNLWVRDQDMSGFEKTLRYAILCMIKVPYFLGGVIAVLLNLVLPKNMDIGDEPEPEVQPQPQISIESVEVPLKD